MRTTSNRSLNAHFKAFTRASSALALGALVLSSYTTTAQAQRRRRRETPTTTAPATPAADESTTRARALFAEGVRFASAHDFEQAEARFREALALRDAPAIRYNLASVLFEQGEYSEALIHNTRVVGDAGAPPEVRESAHQLDRQIASHAAYLRVAEGAVPAGATVTIDGFTVDAPTLETPVAPGHRTLRITGAEGEVVFERALDLTSGERHILGLELLEHHQAPVADTTPGHSIDQEEWFWPVVGGGAGLVVVIVVVASVASAPPQVEGPISGNFSPGVIRW